jgi:phosphohistidine phosphatase
MPQLFVLRHAKSSWDDPGLDDHDRPLAPRGRRATKLIAEHLQAHDYHPDLILCSTARRTRETLDGIALTGTTHIEPELYGASAGDILERLHQVPSDAASAMVIGHNPALQILVLRLTSGHDGAALDDLAEVQRKFPTGALAVLVFDVAWKDLRPGAAELVAFVRPKVLAR